MCFCCILKEKVTIKYKIHIIHYFDVVLEKKNIELIKIGNTGFMMEYDSHVDCS